MYFYIRIYVHLYIYIKSDKHCNTLQHIYIRICLYLYTRICIFVHAHSKNLPPVKSLSTSPLQSVMHCVAVLCSVLQCVAVSCSVLQRVAACCSVLQRAAVCCSVLQRLTYFPPNLLYMQERILLNQWPRRLFGVKKQIFRLRR